MSQHTAGQQHSEGVSKQQARKKNFSKASNKSPRISGPSEIDKVAREMYDKCYIGHIQPEQWQKFAKFCVAYAKRKTKKLELLVMEANHAAWEADKNWSTYA